MKTARNVAGHYNHSSQAAASLKALATALGITKTSLDNDVVTRFWSTHKFAESMVILKPAIISLQDKTPENCHMSPTDWLIIQSATVLLEPFMIVQQLLEGEKYVTNSLVIPLVYDLRNKLQTVVNTYTTICASAESTTVAEKVLPTAVEMLKVFNEKFGDGTQICLYEEGPRRQPKGFYPDQVCATALDPRTKDLVGVPDNEKQEVWELLKERVVSRMLIIAEKSTPVGTVAPGTPSSVDAQVSSSDAAISKRTNQLFRNLFAASIQPRNTSVPASQQVEMPLRTLYEGIVAEEIRRYRNESALDFFDEEGNVKNPLLWWKNNESLYPHLSKFSRRVLAIPATSAPSERVFSVAGQIVTKKRTRLTGDAVTLLVWLKGAWDEVDDYVKTEKEKKKRKII
jgi:hypothetical protein